MKQLFFYILTFVLTIGFANADVAEYKDKKSSESTDCPYLNSIMNSNKPMECPFISDKSKFKNECPYTEKIESGKCPYKDEMKEGNLKIDKNNTPEIEPKSS